MYPLMIRLTVDKNLSELNDVFSEYEKYIISEEIGDRKHFHVLLYHPEFVPSKRLTIVRKFLKKKLPVSGNKDYSLKNVEDINNKVDAYVLKDGKYVYKGYTEEDINNLYKLSYRKYKAGDFKKDLETIVQEYLLMKDYTQDGSGKFQKGITLKMFIKKYMELKVRYNQNININTIMSYVRLIDCKKNGVDQYVDEVVSKLNYIPREYF